MPSNCTCAGCDSPARNNTSPYCEKHYARWRRHGNPDIALKDHTPAAERWKTCYVETPGPLDTPCWIWTGRGQRDGYGLISNGAAHTSIPAHKFVYELKVGPVPDGLELDHLCEIKRCIRPEHVEPVTNGENQLRAARARSRREPYDDVEKRRMREAMRAIRQRWYDDPSLCNRCGGQKYDQSKPWCADCYTKKGDEYLRKKQRERRAIQAQT
jgi:ribosomal protein L37E